MLENIFRVDRAFSSQKQRIAHGFFWSSIGMLSIRGSALLSSVLIARVLGKQGFGEFGIIQNTILMMGVFASFGTSLSATKYIAELRDVDPPRAGRIIGGTIAIAALFGTAASCLLFILAPWLALKFLAAPQLGNTLRVGALYLMFSAINGAQTGALTGFEAFKLISRVHFIAGVASLPVVAIGVLVFGLDGAVWGYSLSMLFTCWLCQRALERVVRDFRISIDYRDCIKEIKVLWQFSLPAMLANSLVIPVTWICNAMLVNQPGGYAEMGIYSVATQWRQVTLFIPGIIFQVMVPVTVSNAQVSIRNKIKANFQINSLVALPILIVLSALSPFIMEFYGRDFRQGWFIFVLAQCAAFLQVLQAPVVTQWIANGQMWLNFSANLCWGSTLVVLTWLLIGQGAQGLVIALLLSFVLFGIVMLLLLPKTLNPEGVCRQ